MKKVLVIILTLALMATSVFADTQVMIELGIVNGRGDGLQEEEILTRAEALVLISRTVDMYLYDIAYETSPYDDIEGHWAYDTICAFHRMGFIDTTAKSFRPDEGISGNEFLKILMSAMGYKDVTEGYIDSIGMDFADSKKPISRSEAFELCERALKMKTADGKVLWEKIAENNPQKADKLKEMFGENLTFADRLNQNIPKNENYMISPLSVKMAMAMAANGSEGETLKEITEVLGIESLEEYNKSAKALIETYVKEDVININIANSIWINKDEALFDFTVPFKTAVETYYKGEVKSVDNSNAVSEINNWVSDKTNDKIPTIIDESDFAAMLINAVYFKAKWLEEFDEEFTRKEDFTDINGKVTQIDFMNKTRYCSYAQTDNAEIVSIPYKRGKDLNVNMYVLLPKNGEGEINPVQEIEKGSFSSKKVTLSIPKFKIEFSAKLKNALKEMGISNAFVGGKAEFGPMTGDDSFYIQEVIHKTYIDVNERETEAAAVTAVIMAGASAVSEPPIVFKADRPFSFVIADDSNDEILFMGQYNLAR